MFATIHAGLFSNGHRFRDNTCDGIPNRKSINYPLQYKNKAYKSTLKTYITDFKNIQIDSHIIHYPDIQYVEEVFFFELPIGLKSKKNINFAFDNQRRAPVYQLTGY